MAGTGPAPVGARDGRANRARGSRTDDPDFLGRLGAGQNVASRAAPIKVGTATTILRNLFKPLDLCVTGRGRHERLGRPIREADDLRRAGIHP